ncbi:MAG TPA: response regulator, partial [Gaiellales bacterium]|nr:response regulator [Gaiellales bacterium]
MSGDALPTEMPAAEPRPRILIVDDQRNMRTTTALLLRAQGYEVAEAESGEAALSRLLADPFDVVLTDLKMPGRDGLAVLAELGPALFDLPVIVVTAYGGSAAAIEAMRRGAYEYLLKPL